MGMSKSSLIMSFLKVILQNKAKKVRWYFDIAMHLLQLLHKFEAKWKISITRKSIWANSKQTNTIEYFMHYPLMSSFLEFGDAERKQSLS
jgi:hypothetical protein